METQARDARPYPGRPPLRVPRDTSTPGHACEDMETQASGTWVRGACRSYEDMELSAHTWLRPKRFAR
jgi:hypothetical protein